MLYAAVIYTACIPSHITCRERSCGDHNNKAEQDVARMIEQSGGRVAWDGERQVVISVDFSNCKVKSSDLSLLGRLRNVTTLNLDNTGICDDDGAVVGKLLGLQ